MSSWTMFDRPEELLGKEIELTATMQCWECEQVEQEEICPNWEARGRCGRRDYRLQVTSILYSDWSGKPAVFINGWYRFTAGEITRFRICKGN